MSDLRCLPKFSFGDVENYIKEKLYEICGGYGTDDIQNTMVREKSYALHSEKGHIMKIVITDKGTEIMVTSNVKHSMLKKNVCSIKVIFNDLTKPGLKSVTANCDCKYGKSGFCSHVCAVFYRLASYELLKYDYVPDSDFSSTVSPYSWKAPKPANMVNLSANNALQQQHLALVNTKFGHTYRISGLALQQHDELDKEYIFFIDTYVQQTYPKNMDYPPLPLQSLPSLEELNLSHTNIWWSSDIMLSKTDCAALEAQNIAQRANQIWHDAHLKRLLASQVGHILNRKRQPSFAHTTASATPFSLQHGIENEEKALLEYKKATVSKGFQVDIFSSGFVTHSNFFGLEQCPMLKFA